MKTPLDSTLLYSSACLVLVGVVTLAATAMYYRRGTKASRSVSNVGTYPGFPKRISGTSRKGASIIEVVTAVTAASIIAASSFVILKGVISGANKVAAKLENNAKMESSAIERQLNEIAK